MSSSPPVAPQQAEERSTQMDQAREPEAPQGPPLASEIAHAKRQRQLWLAIGAAVIVGFVLYGASAFQESLTPYVSLGEAMSSGDRVQVAAKLVPGSERYTEQTGQLQFELTDEQGLVMPVVYRGTTPGNFKEATQIVVMGSFTDGTFQARSLLTKCPSKYQGQEQPG